MKKAYVAGAGLCGSVIARQLAENGFKVTIWEKRNHISGNMYDYEDEHGIVVSKYGPHTFHTNDRELYEYMLRFSKWQDYRLYCGAVWDGKYTPSPFNFKTIDTFYDKKEAGRLKKKFAELLGEGKEITVVDALNHSDEDVRKFAEFLFENDYAPYTAKQWNVSPENIDPSILARVPIRMSYREGYFSDIYEMQPEKSYNEFFENLLNHENIEVMLEEDALDHIRILDNTLLVNYHNASHNSNIGETVEENNKLSLAKQSNESSIFIYTGQIDRLFDYEYGRLPYRSLRFDFCHSDAESYQPVAIIAYPKATDYTRITEYNKMIQVSSETKFGGSDGKISGKNARDNSEKNSNGSSYAVEYPLPADDEGKNEPYYPVLTKESCRLFELYSQKADKIKNLYCCGRLADFKYYNMDQALRRALNVSMEIIDTIGY